MAGGHSVNRPAVDRDVIEWELYGTVRFGTDCRFASLLTDKESLPVIPFTKSGSVYFQDNGVRSVVPRTENRSLPSRAVKVHIVDVEHRYSKVVVLNMTYSSVDGRRAVRTTGVAGGYPRDVPDPHIGPWMDVPRRCLLRGLVNVRWE